MRPQPPQRQRRTARQNPLNLTSPLRNRANPLIFASSTPGPAFSGETRRWPRCIRCPPASFVPCHSSRDGPFVLLLSSATGAAVGRKISKLGSPPVGSPRLSKGRHPDAHHVVFRPVPRPHLDALCVTLLPMDPMAGSEDQWDRSPVLQSEIQKTTPSPPFCSAIHSRFPPRDRNARFLGGHWRPGPQTKGRGRESRIGHLRCVFRRQVLVSSSSGISRTDTLPEQRNWRQGPGGWNDFW